MVSILPREVTWPDLWQLAIDTGIGRTAPNKDKTVTKYRIFRAAMSVKLWYDPLKEVTA